MRLDQGDLVNNWILVIITHTTAKKAAQEERIIHNSHIYHEQRE